MEEKKTDPNEWALSYGDMITLLMTFFVLIIAMSSDKMDDVAEIMKKGEGDNLYVAELRDAGMFDTKVRSMSKIEIDVEKRPPPVTDIDLIREDLVVFMTENDLFNVVDLLKTKEGFTIRIKADILFDQGDTSLKIENLYLLDKIAELLSIIPNNVRIEGHTDDRYVDDYDTAGRISIARASSVCGYIIDEERLLSSRFGVAGYGRQRSLYPNTNEHNRAKNRRVEIIIEEISRDV